MGNELLYLAPLFLIIAIVYAMIGQGGASAYLAILALFNLPYEQISPTALACNIVATSGVAYHFAKAGHLKKRLVLPFVVTSIPAAFIGGGILLMPLIIFFRWGSVKEAALAGGLFTLLNSISGLLGHGIRGNIDPYLLIPLALAVLIGSQIGAHLGAKKVPSGILQKIFAVLLFGVAVRLIISLL